MSIEALRARLPDFLKDVRLNLSALANEETLPGPTKWGLLLACAIASRNAEVREAFSAEAAEHLTPAAQDAARAAAAIMAMNNVYYRSVHLASNKEYAKTPARLRMNVIGSPGVPRTDFEILVFGGFGHQRLRRLHRFAREGVARSRGQRGGGAGRATLCGDRAIGRRRPGGDDAGRRTRRLKRSRASAAAKFRAWAN